MIDGISDQLKNKLAAECKKKTSMERAKEIIIARKLKSRLDAELLRDKIKLKKDTCEFFEFDY